MSELALFLVRIGFVAVLWIFIFSIISVIRADIFGQKVVRRATSPARVRFHPPAHAGSHRPAPRRHAQGVGSLPHRSRPHQSRHRALDNTLLGPHGPRDCAFALPAIGGGVNALARTPLRHPERRRRKLAPHAVGSHARVFP